MAGITEYKIEEPYLDISCTLGEAPFFDASQNVLRFVDITKKQLHTINLSEGPSSLRTIDLEHSIGTTADIEDNENEFIFGGKKGYGIMKKDTGEARWIKMMWADAKEKDGDDSKGERMRSNDGAVDPLDDKPSGSPYSDEGVLFRLDTDLNLQRIIEGLTIPNGTSWSLDNKTMFFTDSPSKSIMAYPYDPVTGDIAVSSGKVFFTVEEGVPDGHCQDEHGNLWIANHGAGKVWSVNPQGEVLAVINLPTRCVTCPVFCGTELFITSLTNPELDTHPWGKYRGALFKIDVGVRGRPLNKFKMNPNL